jgi:hypothetical protein
MSILTHWIYENDQGTWSPVSEKMEVTLNDTQREFIFAGINSLEYFPSPPTIPTHGIASHLIDGVSGRRLWIQYNLETDKARLLSRIEWKTQTELKRILQDNSMMKEWSSVLSNWKESDLVILKKRN